jgi:hypothetical protein
MNPREWQSRRFAIVLQKEWLAGDAACQQRSARMLPSITGIF